jgi:uncharacterized protein (TIGR02265 family)
MTEYLAALPRGLGAYPACQQKAGILRTFMTAEMRQCIEAAVPPELRELLVHPPPVTAWIPEVQATALYLAGRDAMGSDEAYVDMAYGLNRDLLSGAMYRVLFAFVSPTRVLMGAASRWGQIHRGTDLRAVTVTRAEAVLRLTGPPNLIPHVMALAYGTAFRAALELAGGKNVVVSCRRDGPEGCTYLASWR